jgi:hypothetical protein
MRRSGIHPHSLVFKQICDQASVWAITEAKRCRTYGARDHSPLMSQPFRAGLTIGGPALRAFGADCEREGGASIQ